MLKYFVNNQEVSKDDFYGDLENAIRNYVEENIDDIIDDIEEEIQIGSLTFAPSTVLKTCDPIAYSLYIDDEANYMFENVEDEFENSEEDYEETYDNTDFKVAYIEEEEEEQ